MRIPWLRRNFLARRRLDRVFLDVPDAVMRSLSGRSHWPPYSLRTFVGDARGFERVGRWFVEDLTKLGLVGRGTRVLEIGCGCGRLARPLAADETLRELGLSYTGMDIDHASIDWCRRHIAPLNSRFHFYHADCHNASYNPGGTIAASSYWFPHPGNSFDLILLTSVFTHVLPDELTHYLSEIARLLAPDGTAYASFFLYGSPGEAGEARRHPLEFSFTHDDYAVSSKDHPANGVAFNECYLRKAIHGAGLKLLGAPRYGGQDLLLITREPNTGSPHLLNGWHEPEGECWRWTERAFAVRLPYLPENATTLRFRFTIAAAVLEEAGTVRLRASVNGVALQASEYTAVGERVYVQNILQEALRGGELPLIQFELEKAYRSSGPDQRELGVQVRFWAYCNEERRPLNAIEIA